MPSLEELKVTINEQKEQIASYERKLKDVVSAYKSVEGEKKALEAALSSLNSTSASIAQASEPTNNDNPLEALRTAIKTLTVENKRKELAFKADKKVLVEKNLELKNRLDAVLSNSRGNISQKQMDRFSELKSNYERVLLEQQDNQQKYQKEKQHSEKMEKSVTELSQRLNEKDQCIRHLESKLHEANKKFEQDLKKTTPAVNIMKDELINAKNSFEKEFAMVADRYNHQSLIITTHITRIEQLETRVRELSEQGAASAKKREDLDNQVKALQRELLQAKEENALLCKTDSYKFEKNETREFENINETNFSSLLLCFKEMYERLRKYQDFNIYDELSLADKEVSLTKEKHKCGIKVDSQNGATACVRCDFIKIELDKFKDLSFQQQKKLVTLEAQQTESEENYESMLIFLKQRISELESKNEKDCQHFQLESKQKVVEIESELQKQRDRLLEIIAEKDREITLIKKKLSIICGSSTQTNLDPVDPVDPRQLKGHIQYSPDSLARISLLTDSIEANAMTDKRDKRTSFHFDETKNMFYEQEITKQKQEMSELRNVLKLLESKFHDVEQSSLMKDIQYLQIIETLKEEIRVLEGQLALKTSHTNMSYLRNIFVRLLNSKSVNDQKHILKAIGAVLQLTQTEMKRIDLWVH